jgi:hypothetical protein
MLALDHLRRVPGPGPVGRGGEDVQVLGLGRDALIQLGDGLVGGGRLLAGLRG